LAWSKRQATVVIGRSRRAASWQWHEGSLPLKSFYTSRVLAPTLNCCGRRFSHSRVLTPAISSGGLLEQHASFALAARLSNRLATAGLTHVREAYV